MKIIDMHCDTISELADRGGELWKNSGHLDLKRMQESGYLLQNFALFVEPSQAALWTLIPILNVEKSLPMLRREDRKSVV